MLTAPGTVSAPPRPVSLRNTLSLFFSANSVVLSYFAYFIALFLGLIFYQPADDPALLLRDHHPLVEGQITEVEVRPGSSSMGKTTQSTSYEYHYQYQVDGKTYRSSVLDDDELEGQLVTVQYLPGQPHVSRLVGLGYGPMPRWLILIPACMLALAFKLTWSGVREMQEQKRLIRHGVVTEATVTLSASNEIRLQFATADGNTHSFAPDGAAGKLGIGRRTDVIYLPEAPAAAMRLQALDAKPRAILLASTA